MLKKVFERVKMDVVVATFPCTVLLTMTWGKAGTGRERQRYSSRCLAGSRGAIPKSKAEKHPELDI